MPRSLQQDLVRHRAVREDLIQALGRVPADDEVAAAAGTSVARVRRQRVAARMCQPVSADTPSGSQVNGVCCDASAGAFARVDDLVSLAAAVRTLSARDRRVLELRFLCELSQSEIAGRLGVSQMHVSRILRSILTRLRAHMS